MTDRTALYRAYDTAGALLYVGIARNWASRWTQHADRSSFFKTTAQLRVEYFESRDEALAAERRAIENEHPRYNIRLNGDRRAPDARPGSQQGLHAGDWVAVALIRPVGPHTCPVGAVQYVGPRGFRLTLADWVLGTASSWDLWVPWRNVDGLLVATEHHDLTYFGDVAADFQRSHRCHVSAP